MALQAAITGWGWHSPARTLDNHAIEKLVDTNDEWIRSRTGIAERHVVGPGETSMSMGLIAARAALDRAQLSPLDLDLVIFASTTPDFLLPASACLIQQKLGATRAGAFDINAACSGFVYGLTVGSQFIQTGMYRRVLVVTGEVLSRFVNWQDRNTCILFGDGAAAIVLEATTQDAGLLSSVLGSRGDVEGMLTIEAGGGAKPATAETVANGDHWVRMRGNEVFRMAVRNMVHSAKEALHRAELTLDDLRVVIPHQANSRIITATQDSLGVDPAKVFVNLDRYGNTGAASVGLALGEYMLHNEMLPGDNVLLVAFGGGLTWGAAVLRWADIAAIRQERNLGQRVAV